MFENTLLIVKSDYMPRRKCLILHLLSKGFQIQARRKLVFKPEDAAEFYKDLEDDKCYMLYVILLSKGTSEAIVVTKENAALELVETLVCFFGTSMEMDRNVHVSRNVNTARREISFIFPNYIHEPFDYFDKHTFVKEPVLEPLLCEAFNLTKKQSDNDNEDWRVQISDWLLKKNSNYPRISNQCSRNLHLAVQEKAQQTEGATSKHKHTALKHHIKKDGVCSSSSVLTGATSDLMSTSSCISCSSFKSGEGFTEKQQLVEFEKRLKLRATRTIRDECLPAIEVTQTICEEIDVAFESTSTTTEDIKNITELMATGPILEELPIAKEILCHGSEEDHPGSEPKSKPLPDVVSEKMHSKEEIVAVEESEAKLLPAIVEEESEEAEVDNLVEVDANDDVLHEEPVVVAKENVVEHTEPVEEVVAVEPPPPAEGAQPEAAPEEETKIEEEETKPAEE